jgi:hypothetical protein
MSMPLYGETPENMKEKDAAKVAQLTAEINRLNVAITEMQALAGSAT